MRPGLFPVGDTVTPGGGSYFHYYHADRDMEARWQEDPATWLARHVRHVGESVEAIIRAAGAPSVKVTEMFPPQRTHETNVSIIDAALRSAAFQ